MSWVTNVVLVLDSLDHEERRIAQINAVLVADRPEHGRIVSVDDPDLPKGWYGGSKYLEASIYIGAFNFLNVEAFLSGLRAIDWTDREGCQVLLREQEENAFRLVDIALPVRG